MSDFGDRMKRYEEVSQGHLMRRTPVIIRLDGRAFHTLTRGVTKPWDSHFQQMLWEATKVLCAEVAGCRLAYCQSDEMSLLLIDYTRQNTQPWFDNGVQKLVSVSAGILSGALSARMGRHVAFDARAFNVPEHEVINYFIWRQADAVRNSISALAQANFPHRDLQMLSTDQLQNKLWNEKKINWDDCPVPQKRGALILREVYMVPTGHSVDGVVTRSRWVEADAPTFTQEREYFQQFMRPEEE